MIATNSYTTPNSKYQGQRRIDNIFLVTGILVLALWIIDIIGRNVLEIDTMIHFVDIIAKLNIFFEFINFVMAVLTAISVLKMKNYKTINLHAALASAIIIVGVPLSFCASFYLEVRHAEPIATSLTFMLPIILQIIILLLGKFKKKTMV